MRAYIIPAAASAMWNFLLIMSRNSNFPASVSAQDSFISSHGVFLALEIAALSLVVNSASRFHHGIVSALLIFNFLDCLKDSVHNRRHYRVSVGFEGFRAPSPEVESLAVGVTVIPGLH